MSHSLRHIPIIGNACAGSEKSDKQKSNRRFRRINKALLGQGYELMPQKVHYEYFSKDGKYYWIFNIYSCEVQYDKAQRK